MGLKHASNPHDIRNIIYIYKLVNVKNDISERML